MLLVCVAMIAFLETARRSWAVHSWFSGAAHGHIIYRVVPAKELSGRIPEHYPIHTLESQRLVYFGDTYLGYLSKYGFFVPNGQSWDSAAIRDSRLIIVSFLLELAVGAMTVIAVMLLIRKTRQRDSAANWSWPIRSEKAGKNPNVRWKELKEFLAFADPQKLSPAQRIACLAYAYSSHIQMAGHRDYFWSIPQPVYSEVVSALWAVGATEQASILTAALDAVHAASGRAPEEYSNRFAAGVEFADLTEFDEAWERCTRSVPECLLDYVGRHESEFIEWKP